MRTLTALLARDWTRPRPTAAQLRTDLLVGAIGALACVASVEVYRSAYGADLGLEDVEAYVLFAVTGALLAGRRRFPLSTLVAESALFIVIGVRLGQLAVIFTVQIIVFAVLYAAWAWSRRTRSLYVVTSLVILAMFALLYRSLITTDLPPMPATGMLDQRAAAVVYSLAINVIYLFGAVAWGQSAWRSTRRRAALAEQQERERAAEQRGRERAVRDERVRIARDLHDVVAHHISGIGLQAAGAGRVMGSDPDSARTALSTIESSSREAVSQMHQLVGLLRDAEDPLPDGRAPQPGLAEIAGLAEDTGEADQRPHIEHRVIGDPFPVPGTAGHSLYRIAQEAVTNTRRHSGARQASLVIRYLSPEAGRQVELELTDDGRGTPRATASYDDGSGGFGLTGIRERAAMHGGVVDIGARPQGGFRVRVRIPVEEAGR